MALLNKAEFWNIAYNLVLLSFLQCFDVVGWAAEGHPACKNRVVGCWRGYLCGARCRLAYGPADATATHCRYRVTAASPVCSTEHTCGPTLQTDHIRPCINVMCSYSTKHSADIMANTNWARGACAFVIFIHNLVLDFVALLLVFFLQ